MSAPKKICINTCPTGGWVMNNRKRIEAEMRTKYPDAEISHAVALPFTVSITSDGQRSKRSLGLPMFCCPSCCGIGDAKKFTGEDYVKINNVGGAPGNPTMVR